MKVKCWVCAWTIGSAYGTRENRRFTFTGNVNLHAGTNKLSLLSIAVGLPVSSLFLMSTVKNLNKSELRIETWVPIFLKHSKQEFVSYLVSFFPLFGLKNNGPHFETRKTGIVGPVVIRGVDQGKIDLSWQRWSYKVCKSSFYWFLVTYSCTRALRNLEVSAMVVS